MQESVLNFSLVECTTSFSGSPEAFRLMSLQNVTPVGFVDSFKNKPLDFAVGEKFKYSNSGYFTLGYIIEKNLWAKLRNVCAGKHFHAAEDDEYRL